jgi:hypothetical protein
MSFVDTNKMVDKWDNLPQKTTRVTHLIFLMSLANLNKMVVQKKNLVSNILKSENTKIEEYN